jgi:low molecular weight protein-tyrosine phosphatase
LVEKKRICFVCLGNIVRSPLAENLFTYLAEQAAISDQFEVDSAGTGVWHVGEPPDARMRRVAASHGLKYTGRARQIQPQDLEHFDWIIAMDRENLADLRRLARSSDASRKIRLLREFDPFAGPQAGVPDPYYGGIDGFEEVYQIVERCTKKLLDAFVAGEL